MTAWIVETFVASTLLMLLVLALRGSVARRFGPRVAYALWLLPALRMVLPPLPADVAPAPMAALPEAMHLNELLAAAASLGAPATVAAPIETGIDWAAVMLALWVAGAAAFFVWHLLSYRRFVQRTLAQATQLPRLDRDGIEVCASPVAPGPFAAGIFLKSIVLPLDWRKRYAPDELRLALEHEVQHHRRGDMSANLVALGVLALHWWNPIAHRAHRAFRVDQELACDALVLENATPAERHAYGSALLKSACDRLPVAACALGAGDDLKRRLKMMASYRPDRRRGRAGGLIAAGLVGGGLLLTASGGIAAETTAQVEQKVRTALLEPAGLVQPVALVQPMPPAPPAVAAPKPVRKPVTPALLDDDDLPDAGEIERDVAEAVREAQVEAQAAVAEAVAEVNAIDIEREVLAELRAEMPRMRAEVRRAQAEAHRAARAHRAAHYVGRGCDKGEGVVVRVDDNGHSKVSCYGPSPAERAEMRRTMIESLEKARANIRASMDDKWAARAREQALAAIDRQLDRLRDEQ